MPALGQKLGYLYGKAETKTSKYADRYASQTFPHLGNQKTKGDEQKDILNNIGIENILLFIFSIGIVMRSTQGLKQRQADSCPGARFALKYGYDEYHDKVDDAENA